MLAHPFSPSLALPQVVEESTTWTPLIFVLSPGSDPTGALLQLAEASGMSTYFHALSLGHGQAPLAKTMIEEGIKKGTTPSSLCLFYLLVSIVNFFSRSCLKKIIIRSPLGQI